jgi:predicted ATPase with chaperone activity
VAAPAYDRPIAAGALAATEQIGPEAPERAMSLGELGLDGKIRHTTGTPL